MITGKEIVDGMGDGIRIANCVGLWFESEEVAKAIDAAVAMAVEEETNRIIELATNAGWAVEDGIGVKAEDVRG